MSSGGHGGGGLPGLFIADWVLGFLRKTVGLFIPYWVFILPFIVCVAFFFLVSPEQSIRNFSLLLFISPIWLPLVIGFTAWARWKDARRNEFNARQDWVLLELKIPRDVRKTPLAMEIFFNNIHLTPGVGNWYKKFWLGRTKPWFSLEMVSLGGRVHFYIYTRKSMRHAVETYLYAQYPELEIVEAPDYTRLIDPFKPGMTMWGCEFKKKIEDPFPIKTYTDFGLDKVPVAKPEEVADPLAQAIEFMGSLAPHEQLWIHIMIQHSSGEKFQRAGKPAGYTWQDQAKELIEKIRESTVKKSSYVDPGTGKEVETSGFPNPTKSELETMAAISRNVDKLPFEVGIRAVYIAPKDKVRDYIGAFVTQLYRPMASAWQALGPDPVSWSELFTDMPWEDPGGKIRLHLMHELFEFARRRAYFHYPYVGHSMMTMSTEELATIFHIPSSSVAAPNLPRIQSARTEAPANLPT